MNRIIRPIKEGFFGLIRHLGMSISSILAVSMTLILVAILLVFSLNAQDMLRNVASRIQIHVQLEDEIEMSAIQAIQRQIEAMETVAEVEFSDKDKELNAFIASYGDEGSIFEMYRGERNPLKNAFIVELEEGSGIDAVAAQINRLEGVLSAQYGGVNTVKLLDMLKDVQFSGLVIVSFLTVLALFLITNTINMTISSREHEIAIMRIIGATNGFIRSPFVVEGMMIGFFGSLIPIALSTGAYIYFYNELGGVLLSDLFRLRPIMPFVLQLGLLLVLVGLVVGLIGSFISVTRHLRGVR